MYVIEDSSSPEVNASNEYEACDPLRDIQGKVPCQYFEVVSRPESIITVPLSSLSLKENTQVSGGEVDSVSSLSSSSAAAVQRQSIRSPNSVRASMQPGSRMSTQDKKVQPLYGVVLYDFQAERPDELQAAAGESIIIIAQSNDEWFVAKPIGRLGGPGLIPVSFIQLRDMGSDRPVPEHLVAEKLAAVPKVEEWKRMTAEYKASSIPLSRYGSDQALSSLRDSRASSTGSSHHSDQHQQQQQHLYQQQQQQGQQLGYRTAQQQQQQQHHHQHQHQPQQRHHNHPGANVNQVFVVNASVERYAFDGGRYWYLVICELSNGRFRNLCRYYQDFYDFQIRLLDEFPDEAGRTGRQQRTLPFMPGPLTYVNDSISSQRRANLDEYVHNLLYLPSYISRSSTVQQLFDLREGDIETHARSDAMPTVPSWEGDENEGDDDDDDEGIEENNNEIQEHNEAENNDTDPVEEPSQDSTEVADDFEVEHNDQENSAPGLEYSNHNGSAETQVEKQAQVEEPKKDAEVQIDAAARNMSTSTIADEPKTTAASTTPRQFIKIKVFYKDDLIAIRVPSDIPLDELTRLIGERLQTDKALGLKFKDEVSGDPMFINSSAEFKTLLSGREKIVLYAE